jgi:hypothetical protein
MQIDVAISAERRCDQEINREDSKIYKDPTIEMQRMWNVKTKVKLVIIGATGTISK